MVRMFGLSQLFTLYPVLELVEEQAAPLSATCDVRAAIAGLGSRKGGDAGADWARFTSTLWVLKGDQKYIYSTPVAFCCA